MRKCSGIIMSPPQSKSFGGLTKYRPDVMLPFGARYHIIDFSLSNMTNYDITDVMLYVDKNSRHTLDHIENGKSWELNRRHHGLKIAVPDYYGAVRPDSEIRRYYDTLPHYIYHENENIYIENSMNIAKVDLQDAYDSFVDHNYDVMLLYKKVKDEQGIYNGLPKLILDGEKDLVNVGTNLGTESCFNLYIGRTFIKREVFIQLVKDAIERGTAETLMESIINNKSRLNIGSYEVDDHVEMIHDLTSFFRANMNLLNPAIYSALFNRGGMIYTKSQDEPSTLYASGSDVSNSLVANGCIIEGQVENSIIFRGVRVKKDAIVRNSILFQETLVGSGAVVVNAVTEKYSKIEEGQTLAGTHQSPYVLAETVF